EVAAPGAEIGLGGGSGRAHARNLPVWAVALLTFHFAAASRPAPVLSARVDVRLLADVVACIAGAADADDAQAAVEELLTGRAVARDEREAIDALLAQGPR